MQDIQCHVILYTAFPLMIAVYVLQRNAGNYLTHPVNQYLLFMANSHVYVGEQILLSLLHPSRKCPPKLIIYFLC